MGPSPRPALVPGLPLDAVVFDLDGTLVHSLPGLQRVLNPLLAEDGFAPLEEPEIRRMVGEGVGRLVTRGYAARGWGEECDHPTDPALAARLATFKTRYEADPVAGAEAFPQAVAILRRLADAGLRLGVCTNKPAAPTRTLLEALGLAPFLNAVVAGDTLPQRKPDPAPLRRVLEDLGATPDTALYVGDSPTDVLCARAAGLPVVLMAHGYSREPLDSLGADAILADFPALAARLGLDWAADPSAPAPPAPAVEPARG